MAGGESISIFPRNTGSWLASCHCDLLWLALFLSVTAADQRRHSRQTNPLLNAFNSPCYGSGKR